MDVLVTGGAGFIGSNFVTHILDTTTDCRVINLDKLTYAGNLDNLREVEKRWGGRYFFVRGDIADRELVDSLFADGDLPNPDVIVNFAAESHVDRSIMDAGPFVDTNVKGVQVLLDAARANQVRRFVQVSTDEVYGALSPEDDRKFAESDPLAPNSPYSSSKAAGDLLCRAYHITYDLDVVITRCCNNYGPYQFPEKLIPLMILNSQRGEPLPVYGDGRHVREWIHVQDHCKAIAFVMDRGLAGEIYNIGSGHEMANIEIVRTIVRTVGEQTGIAAGKLEQLIAFVEDRPGHDRRYAIDTEKIRALGWQAEVPFAEGILQTVLWYLEHSA